MVERRPEEPRVESSSLSCSTNKDGSAIHTYMFKVNNFYSEEIKRFNSAYKAPSCEMLS